MLVRREQKTKVVNRIKVENKKVVMERKMKRKKKTNQPKRQLRQSYKLIYLQMLVNSLMNVKLFFPNQHI